MNGGSNGLDNRSEKSGWSCSFSNTRSSDSGLGESFEKSDDSFLDNGSGHSKSSPIVVGFDIAGLSVNKLKPLDHFPTICSKTKTKPADEDGQNENGIENKILFKKKSIVAEIIPREIQRMEEFPRKSEEFPRIQKTSLKAPKQPVEGSNGVEKIYVEDRDLSMDIETDDCLMEPYNFKDGFEANCEAQDIKEETIKSLVLSSEEYMASKSMLRGKRSFQKINGNRNMLCDIRSIKNLQQK